MTILAIETSHDDTSVAIMKNEKVIHMITISQIEDHKPYGGTVPEIASRLHVQNIHKAIKSLTKEFDFTEIDLIAYTANPGLIGALQIGYLAANALAIALNKPIVPINHLEGHFFSAAITQDITYPSVCLLISGGHTQLLYAHSPFVIEIIGQTLDDAVGECYDKVGRKLNLEHPAGPLIDKIASANKDKFNCSKYSFPVTENKYDFSLSGIKTQFINLINNYVNRNEEIPVKKIATDFQNLIVNYLKEKMVNVIEEYQPKSIVLAGGVSANSGIREMFLTLHENSLIPEKCYSTDNAAMIAKVAHVLYNESFKK
ncbi:tRNA (adenosine(37)-N6)-threonylcarbamoyltransferase complex transferase subunit TsaD [Mycoplasma phocoenae]|uniref:tRNA N6-adenosine threonylcarbamoyltransferase n=1 Tax=Mycoplasma phocoenae TaxID=754517 RepID=A0A858U961_9MOLU|nr:tRNA (adenosine(37)-N6)-threonylcarbamoyltransferase complex transferase subunit TsaD [Mycoplasma phocoenae]QJG67236.1 tRNA (adenosine(37)-N6)-threonylcarbamoyltransferase complex transferase subunit TsaD [Mycoplasma phocoenae]